MSGVCVHGADMADLCSRWEAMEGEGETAEDQGGSQLGVFFSLEIYLFFSD